eukprot:12323443-Alexandrium_andersonii.AAC.1
MEALEAGAGREHAASFFGNFLKKMNATGALDVSPVSKQFSTLYFACGFRVGMHQVGATPN